MHKKNKLLPLQSQNNGETNNGFVAHGATPRLDRVSKSNATPIRIKSFGIESLEVKSNLYGFVAHGATPRLDRASELNAIRSNATPVESKVLGLNP